MIKTFNNNGKIQILVAGYDALQTRIAAQALVRHPEFYNQMDSNEVITYGTDIEDIHVD
ncbi:MAG TPA: hypothetical protein VJH97_00900 [Candidatus Nanoarchaeia archaeon]|nr:hypothetical protein [Candidatus Nanoarchaeia archaeon]